MQVTDAVAEALTGLGADTAFGVVGSGNFHVTNALTKRGVRYIAARHECGAACMADGWARLSGRPALLTLHQGPGLTNALTGITEAAKSRTPLLVLAADATAPHSNFRIGVDAVAAAVGAVPARLHSASFAVDDAIRAYRTAADHHTVILAMPLDVQAGECTWPGIAPASPPAPVTAPASEVLALADVLRAATRPVFIAGRGARGARAPLERLAEVTGALLATSAAAKGLFRGSAWDLDVSGGFASPLAAELITAADVVIGWGCSLNMWTLRHGRLIGPEATVVQVDSDAAALGTHQRVDLGVTGDAAVTAAAAADLLAASSEQGRESGRSRGYRSPELRKRIEREVRWRDVPYDDESSAHRIDPRTLTIALDDLLPPERTVAIDSGNFMGYPSMYLAVPDADGFCFTQAYQSIGLGLASAIGSAIARPDRLTVAALGDGGALMGISELETAVRLALPLVVVVYDDNAYGAEVHHFGPDGYPLDTVTFPPVKIARIGRGFGCEAITVRRLSDLGPVRKWLSGPRDRPLLIDAKVTSKRGSWWLEEAFRGH
jgi:thiamine pyrophosphate-dependent acetolactate synthase large subunit-like protein